MQFRHMLQSIVILTRSCHLWPVGALTGEASIPALENLGYRHAKAGVTPTHFATMQIVLPQVCQETAPLEFTPQVAEALVFLLDVLARSTAVPRDHAADGGFAGLLSRNTGTALQDPSSYFDGKLSGVNAAQEPPALIVERRIESGASMRASAPEVNGMSMSHTADHDAATTCEAPSASLMQTEDGLAMPAPFEPHSPEAHALRGAMGFLFILIAFYDELIESGAPGAGDPAGSGRDLH